MTCWIIIAIIALAVLLHKAFYIYQEGNRRYWAYKNVEAQYGVLKRKRFTILQQFIEQLQPWPKYEMEVLKMAADSSKGYSLSMDRYPNLQSISLFREFIRDLKAIETEINNNLLSRCALASKWFEMSDNAFQSWAMPYRGDVPRDLQGSAPDPLIPEEEIREVAKQVSQ